MRSRAFLMGFRACAVGLNAKWKEHSTYSTYSPPPHYTPHPSVGPFIILTPAAEWYEWGSGEGDIRSLHGPSFHSPLFHPCTLWSQYMYSIQYVGQCLHDLTVIPTATNLWRIFLFTFSNLSRAQKKICTSSEKYKKLRKSLWIQLFFPGLGIC